MPNIFLRRLLAMSIEAARSGSTGKPGGTVLSCSPRKVSRLSRGTLRFAVQLVALYLSRPATLDPRRIQQESGHSARHERLLCGGGG